MTPGRARAATLGGGWSLVLTDLAAILLCFFSLAIALTPPARLAPGPVETPRTFARPALDSATASGPRLAEPEYLEALLRDRLPIAVAGITVQDGTGAWLVRFDDVPPAAALDDLLQAIMSLPVSLTVTLVTPETEIQLQAEERHALAQDLGALAERVLVSQGPRRALEVRLAAR